MDKNPVWEYYNPCEEDNKFAECNMCQMKFSLGSKLKKFQSVTTLYRHLENKHTHAWFKLSEAKKAKKRTHEGGHLEESGANQLYNNRTKKQRTDLFQNTISNWVESKEKLGFHSNKAQALHKKLFEWI